MKKLAVIFPGVGYHTDKPLLYYSKKLAIQLGYEVIEASYDLSVLKNRQVKGSAEGMKEAFLGAVEQTETILKNVDFSKYKEVLFISKSLGTAVSSEYANRHKLTVRNVFYTPVEASFQFIKQRGIAFHGTNDDWVETIVVEKGCQEKNLILYKTENADHSMETGDVRADLENLGVIMKQTKEYMEHE